ncbi:DNA-directed RNA polymerase [Suillus paluster]|uniref:DNA-directed RNA polymerase n=1 Tax=Suillus paluster TaxID=48578 RepID=UPI001B883CA4|nr:DNA-directed RNA polymerase [Suillus paluster]KAG1739864.1 DNA-directed RNA polymerase [Suillus paluster]
MPTAITYDLRKHVWLHAERVSNVSSTNFPGHYPEEDHSWVVSPSQDHIEGRQKIIKTAPVEFDLVGVDASIANAYRRILIAEDKVYVWDNTSVVVDEVLAQRIGLVPLNVKMIKPTDRNTLVFRLQVACQRRKHAPKDTTDPSKLYINHEVLSSHFRRVPQGEQEVVVADNPPAPTNLDIVLTKLQPGQEIDMELHAVKGVGKDHAKFCPVATASYRLLPLVILNPDKLVPRELADFFQKCFSPGVVQVDPRTKAVSVDSKKMQKEMMSREVYRHPEFEGCIRLVRVRDHFLFNIESEGFYPPQRLLPEAITVMRAKIATSTCCGNFTK